jgi:hypothetical protein
MNALEMCNACEVEPANLESAAGYCDECEAEARAQDA